MIILQQVNFDGNADVEYMSDEDRHGLREHWGLPSEIQGQLRGDCDDYVFYKFELAKNRGIDTERMTPAACLTEKGKPGQTINHLVLVVEHKGQNYVLDNRRKWPELIQDLPYTNWFFPPKNHKGLVVINRPWVGYSVVA